jgi:hypothetical protein
VRRITGDLDQAKKDMERLRRDVGVKLEEVRRLESDNQRIQTEKYEL